MKCDFCNSEMKKKDEECIFCNGEGCKLCNDTGVMGVVYCENLDCESPDLDIES